MPKRIALTGATGFVGRALLPLLLDVGYDVRALVRNPERADLDKRISVVKGGLADAAALQLLTDEVDVVLHVAGVVAGLEREDFFGPNVEGTVALTEAALRKGVKHFIYVSSLAAREPLLNDYAASKAAAEAALQNYSAKMCLTILRPAAVYGPGDTATLPLLKSLLARVAIIPGSATAQFSMVHVQDVALALADAVSIQRHGTFEIDDGSGGHSWPEISNISHAAFGVPEKVIYIPKALALALGLAGDVFGKFRGKPSLLNSGQLRQVYHADWRVKGQGWPLENPIPLAKGLPETIRWYQAKGLLPLHSSVDRKPPQQDMTG